MAISGTPPAGGDKMPLVAKETSTVAEKSRQNVAQQAEMAEEKSTQHVQRHFRRIIEGLKSKLAADGAAISIKAGIGGDPVIVVTDRYTGEVIREIPPEELRKLAQEIDYLRGVFFDKAG